MGIKNNHSLTHFQLLEPPLVWFQILTRALCGYMGFRVATALPRLTHLHNQATRSHRTSHVLIATLKYINTYNQSPQILPRSIPLIILRCGLFSKIAGTRDTLILMITGRRRTRQQRLKSRKAKESSLMFLVRNHWKPPCRKLQPAVSLVCQQCQLRLMNFRPKNHHRHVYPDLLSAQALQTTRHQQAA